MSADGGVPEAASASDKAYSDTSHHRFPSFLPDGRHFVYSEVVGACCPALKPGRIRLGALDTMDATTLLEAESSAAFASGHLLFNRSGTLMAQGFDATSHRFTGDAFPVMEHVGIEGSRYASFSVSDTGVLVTARWTFATDDAADLDGSRGPSARYYRRTREVSEPCALV